jgi:hypothetical protein
MNLLRHPPSSKNNSFVQQIHFGLLRQGLRGDGLLAHAKRAAVLILQPALAYLRPYQGHDPDHRLRGRCSDQV